MFNAIVVLVLVLNLPGASEQDSEEMVELEEIKSIKRLTDRKEGKCEDSKGNERKHGKKRRKDKNHKKMTISPVYLHSSH